MLSFLAAALTAVCSLIGVYIANRKSAALLEYRMQQLESKVQAHNNLIERVYVAEGQIVELQHDVKDIKANKQYSA